MLGREGTALRLAVVAAACSAAGLLVCQSSPAWAARSSCGRSAAAATLKSFAHTSAGRTLRRQRVGRDVLCFDFTGDRRPDLAFSVARSAAREAAFVAARARGHGFEVALVVRQWGGASSHYASVRLARRGQLIVAGIPIWRAGDAPRCPTGGVSYRSYRWRRGHLRQASAWRTHSAGGCSTPDPGDDGTDGGGGDQGPGTNGAGGGPTNLSPPTVQGHALVGSQVSCDPGLWSGGASSFYFWWDLLTPGQAFTIPAKDAGREISCHVALSPDYYAYPSADSPAVAVAPTTKAVNGVKADGRHFVAPTATREAACIQYDADWHAGYPDWTGANDTHIYWLRDGTQIAGVDNVSYTPTMADVGHQLACKATARFVPADGTPPSDTVNVQSPAVTVSTCHATSSPYCLTPPSSLPAPPCTSCQPGVPAATVGDATGVDITDGRWYTAAWWTSPTSGYVRIVADFQASWADQYTLAQIHGWDGPYGQQLFNLDEPMPVTAGVNHFAIDVPFSSSSPVAVISTNVFEGPNSGWVTGGGSPEIDSPYSP